MINALVDTFIMYTSYVNNFCHTQLAPYHLKKFPSLMPKLLFVQMTAMVLYVLYRTMAVSTVI